MLYIKFVLSMVKMRRLIKYLIIPFLVSCNPAGHAGNKDIITVSISPFRYFVEAIGGDDFDVNVMVPAGADPHIYEPAPQQITSLSRSVAFIGDGYLGFELTWLDRFYEANRNMMKMSMAQNIDLIKVREHHSGSDEEGADPHYWVSPKNAFIMAASVRSLLSALKPENREKYEKNFSLLSDTIASLDKKAKELFSGFEGKTFMIFHPALGYLARDYHLVQLAVENEGKEPSPSYMKELIDESRARNIKVIFIQKGFDSKNAGAIASETGASLVAVDPLGENWVQEVSDIIDAVHESLVKSTK
jgi:zinc transport system substrate-binding protein